MHPALRDEPIRQIGIFRARALGDLLCAVPTWRAVQAAWPEAELTLIGLPWARDFVKRLPLIQRFIEFPGYPGLPETVPDLDALPTFLQQVQAERFDLLLQMHGSGGIEDPLLATFGARHVSGFMEPGRFAGETELFAPWPEHGHEIERLLALPDHLDLARQGLALEFPVNDADRIELAGVFPEAFGGKPFVCLHAGAQHPSRRWSPARFAEVGNWLADQGHTVVLTGTTDEAALVAQVRDAMRHTAVNLAGVTSLWTLGALIERARVVVCNDTGVSHLAAALNTPSLVIGAGPEQERWAPLNSALHPVLWDPSPPTALGCGDDIGAGLAIDTLASLVDPEPEVNRIELFDAVDLNDLDDLDALGEFSQRQADEAPAA